MWILEQFGKIEVKMNRSYWNYTLNEIYDFAEQVGISKKEASRIVLVSILTEIKDILKELEVFIK